VDLLPDVYRSCGNAGVRLPALQCGRSAPKKGLLLPIATA
jgi:hypothetical protein